MCWVHWVWCWKEVLDLMIQSLHFQSHFLSSTKVFRVWWLYLLPSSTHCSGWVWSRLCSPSMQHWFLWLLHFQVRFLFVEMIVSVIQFVKSLFVSPPRVNSPSVVFVFSISPNALPPSFPILFSVKHRSNCFPFCFICLRPTVHIECHNGCIRLHYFTQSYCSFFINHVVY